MWCTTQCATWTIPWLEPWDAFIKLHCSFFPTLLFPVTQSKRCWGALTGAVWWLGNPGKPKQAKAPLGNQPRVCVMAGYFQPRARKGWWSCNLLPIMALVCPGALWGAMVVSSPDFTLPQSEDAQILFCKACKETGKMPYAGLVFCPSSVEGDHFIPLILYLFSKSRLHIWWKTNI